MKAFRSPNGWAVDLMDAENAIKAAVIAEREACAKVCNAVDSLIATIQTVGIPNVGARKVLNKACEDAAKCAKDIRARSEK